MAQKQGPYATPVNVIWENILFIPIFGIIDSKRGQEILESMLTKIADVKSKSIILDILGVPTVDSAVANNLIKIAKATKLMGTECIISGISPEVAQAMVNLGIDLGDVETTGDIADALRLAFDRAGLEVRPKKTAA
ncbi:MAG: STAS domain-containing protein [Deltaproteobacteria bacterium]|nr:STAS domain-containing protein [Deltaproteobacteria bacterium]MBW2136729.1 STAS domain-containing protein [Deltaproteobacteria bacterium]